MTIGSLHVSFMIFEAQSLKEKRKVMRSVKDRLLGTFNISVAEVGSNDKWQIGELGIVTVANQSLVVQRVLQKVEDFLETTPRIRVIELERELF